MSEKVSALLRAINVDVELVKSVRKSVWSVLREYLWVSNDYFFKLSPVTVVRE